MKEKKGDGCTDCDKCPSGCACIHTIGTCRCVRRCSSKSGKFTTRDNVNKNKRMEITEKTPVTFRARKVPLDQIALLINELLPERVLVPATKMNKIITMRVENAQISKIIKSLGLQIT